MITDVQQSYALMHCENQTIDALCTLKIIMYKHVYLFHDTDPILFYHTALILLNAQGIIALHWGVGGIILSLKSSI